MKISKKKVLCWILCPEYGHTGYQTTFFALDELLVPYPNQISSFTFEIDFNVIMINVFGSKILRIISTIDHCKVCINQTVNIYAFLTLFPYYQAFPRQPELQSMSEHGPPTLCKPYPLRPHHLFQHALGMAGNLLPVYRKEEIHIIYNMYSWKKYILPGWANWNKLIDNQWDF